MTAEEIITFLEGCKPNTRLSDSIDKLDPSLTPERIHYLRARLRSNLTVDGPYVAAAVVLREEQPVSVACAALLWSYASYLYGLYSVKTHEIDNLTSMIDKMAKLTKSLKENLGNGEIQKG